MLLDCRPRADGNGVRILIPGGMVVEKPRHDFYVYRPVTPSLAHGASAYCPSIALADAKKRFGTECAVTSKSGATIVLGSPTLDVRLLTRVPDSYYWPYSLFVQRAESSPMVCTTKVLGEWSYGSASPMKTLCWGLSYDYEELKVSGVYFCLYPGGEPFYHDDVLIGYQELAAAAQSADVMVTVNDHAMKLEALRIAAAKGGVQPDSAHENFGRPFRTSLDVLLGAIHPGVSLKFPEALASYMGRLYNFPGNQGLRTAPGAAQWEYPRRTVLGGESQEWRAPRHWETDYARDLPLAGADAVAYYAWKVRVLGDIAGPLLVSAGNAANRLGVDLRCALCTDEYRHAFAWLSEEKEELHAAPRPPTLWLSPKLQSQASRCVHGSQQYMFVSHCASTHITLYVYEYAHYLRTREPLELSAPDDVLALLDGAVVMTTALRGATAVFQGHRGLFGYRGAYLAGYAGDYGMGLIGDEGSRCLAIRTFLDSSDKNAIEFTKETLCYRYLADPRHYVHCHHLCTSEETSALRDLVPIPMQTWFVPAPSGTGNVLGRQFPGPQCCVYAGTAIPSIGRPAGPF